MKLIEPNLTDPEGGFLRDAAHVSRDADPLFNAILRPASYADSDGVTCVKIPPKIPIKDECLRHFVFFGQRHLRFVISEYMTHDGHERIHQGLGGTLINPNAVNDNDTPGDVRCRSRLGGLPGFCHRDAA